MSVMLFGIWAGVSAGLVAGMLVGRVGGNAQRQRAFAVALVCAGVAGPVVGLVGTVLGLRAAFDAVEHTNPEAKATLLAAGISEAMNATALGIALAVIPFAIGVVGLVTARRAGARPPPAGPPSNPAP